MLKIQTLKFTPLSALAAAALERLRKAAAGDRDAQADVVGARPLLELVVMAASGCPPEAAIQRAAAWEAARGAVDLSRVPSVTPVQRIAEALD